MPALAIRWVGDPRMLRGNALARKPDTTRMAFATAALPPSPQRATPWLPDHQPQVYSGTKLRNLLSI
jgi:hypothetical protein